MPLESPRGRKQVVITKSVPAPIGGLNYRDSAAAMPPTDALRLLNFVPLPYAVALRKGWQHWTASPYPSVIGTLANHVIDRSSTGQHVIVCSNFSFYVQFYRGDFPTLPLVTGLSSSVWQHTMLVNDNGVAFTYFVSEGSKPYVYQGTAGPSPTSTFTQVSESLVDPPPGFDVFGIDPTKFKNICLHKNRLWFVEANSQNAWYLPPASVGGAVTKFPLGSLFSKGGTLQAIYTWSVDAGAGMDDYIVFISSEGQVAIYGGEVSDDTWLLAGVWDIGAPIGLKCGCKYGGELLLITMDGVVPMTKALQSTRVNSNIAITDKIQQQISELISLYWELSGWQLILFPKQNQVWLITPQILTTVGGVVTGEAVKIFSMNTITGAWCEFNNMDIRDVCLWSDTPLFGMTNGHLGLAWQGYLDGVNAFDVGGDYINAEVLTAYNYFDSPAQNKRWVFARPIFQSGTVPPANINISVDFGFFDSAGDVTVPAGSATALWDIGLWDVDHWAEDVARYRRWITVQGIGYCAALLMRVRMNSALLWTATDFVYEPGAVI